MPVHDRSRAVSFRPSLVAAAWVGAGMASAAVTWNGLTILHAISDHVLPLFVAAPSSAKQPDPLIPVAHAPARTAAMPHLARPVVAGYSPAAIQRAQWCTLVIKPPTAGADALTTSCPLAGGQALARGSGRKADRLRVAPQVWSTAVIDESVGR
jgi:hypothetical protein